MQIFDLMHIYQIGDMVTNFGLTAPMSHDFAYTASNKRMIGSNRFGFGKPAIGAPKTHTINGNLYATNLWNVNQIMSKLEGLAPFEQDIIGYINLDECGDVSREYTPDVYTNGLLWFTTRGFLTNVGLSSNEGNYQINISITLKDYWEVLDRLKWAFRGEGFGLGSAVDFATEFSVDPEIYKSPFVSVEDALGYDTSGFKWFKRNYTNDPNTWSVVYQDLYMAQTVTAVRPGFPDIGEFSSIGNLASFATYVDDSIFNAPPKSIYSIMLDTGFTFGTISLSLTHYKYDTTSYVTIDLSQLDTDLSDGGFTGIQDGDLLFFGDTHVKPGFIIRNDTLISTVFPQILYSGNFPGQLEAGYNDVFFTGVDPAMDLSYYHYFRRR